ncbi:FEKKY domain-containing protein [Empedobacter falsenii]|uniref:FEKKY domain-containing protein n=1 Tax=Empedobacter falsenii TaxID=343874 RepID=UPI000691ADE6|nr:hypothetical protein [Empedobacter falsenii]
MKNKLIAFNIIAIGLILLYPILEFYCIYYPLKFKFSEIFNQIEYQNTIFILVGIFIFSSLISLFRIDKLLKFNLGLNFLLIILFFSSLINQLIDLKKEEKEYIERALDDIKKDKIVFLYSGGFEIPEYSPKTYAGIDSIHQKYGVDYKNIGILDLKHDILELKYKETVKPYLEKRNGKDWEKRMQKELDEIKKENLF